MPSGFLAKLIAIGAMVLVGGTLIVGFVIWHHSAAKDARDTAYLAGQTAERLVWQQRLAVAEAKAEKDRQTAQAEISRVETEFWKRSVSDRETIFDLEEALKDEKEDDAALPDDRCSRPPVSKRVRDNLNRIGRD